MIQVDGVDVKFSKDPISGENTKSILFQQRSGRKTWMEKRTLYIAAAPSDRIYSGVPRWFVETMRKIDPSSSWWETAKVLPGRNGEASVMVFRDNFRPLDWLDHAGWLKQYGRVKLISEPYGLDAEEAAALLDFVKRCDLVLDIHGTSFHYPTETIRIEIYPKRKQ